MRRSRAEVASAEAAGTGAAAEPAAGATPPCTPAIQLNDSTPLPGCHLFFAFAWVNIHNTGTGLPIAGRICRTTTVVVRCFFSESE